MFFSFSKLSPISFYSNPQRCKFQELRPLKEALPRLDVRSMVSPFSLQGFSLQLRNQKRDTGMTMAHLSSSGLGFWEALHCWRVEESEVRASSPALPSSVLYSRGVQSPFLSPISCPPPPLEGVVVCGWATQFPTPGPVGPLGGSPKSCHAFQKCTKGAR